MHSFRYTHNRKKLKHLAPVYREQAEVFLKMSRDAVSLRRLHLVGLKMRIFLERQKAVNAMEFLRIIKSGGTEKVVTIEQFKN